MIVLQIIAAVILIVLIGAVALGCEKTDRRYEASKTTKVSHDVRRLGRDRYPMRQVERLKPDFDDYSDYAEEGFHGEAA